MNSTTLRKNVDRMLEGVSSMVQQEVVRRGLRHPSAVVQQVVAIHEDIQPSTVMEFAPYLGADPFLRIRVSAWGDGEEFGFSIDKEPLTGGQHDRT
jgi:hypothetical protein